MKNHNFRRILSAAALALVLVLFVGAAFAEETAGADATSMKAIAAAVTIGLASHQGGQDDDGADFMELADMALLKAKDMARDMVLHANQMPLRHHASSASA